MKLKEYIKDELFKIILIIVYIIVITKIIKFPITNVTISPIANITDATKIGFFKVFCHIFYYNVHMGFLQKTEFL